MSKLIINKSMEREVSAVRPFEGFRHNVFDPHPSSVLPAEAVEPGTIVPWNPSFDEPESEAQTDAQGHAPEDPLSPPQPQVPAEIIQMAQDMLDTAHEQSQTILQCARDEADRILDAARKHSEEIEASAYQAAFAQGEIAGQQLGEQKIEPILRNLRAVIESFVAQQTTIFHANEQDLVKIAFQVALQVIQRELQQDLSVVLDVVRAAIAKVQRASRITVYVSHQDFKYIEDHLDLLNQMTDAGTSITIEPEAAIHRGGCRILSDTGEVDATIDSMILQLRDRIWEQE